MYDAFFAWHAEKNSKRGRAGEETEDAGKESEPDGEPRPALTCEGKNSETLKCEPQRELNEAREVILASDLAKRGAAAAARIGRIELRLVESVEELRPELAAKPFVRTKFGVLEEGKIEVLHAVAPNVRFRARIAERTADGEVGRVAICEYGRVEPVGQPSVQRARGQMGQSSSGRAGTRHVWNTGATKRARATADDDREACLECNDGIDSPSADELVCHAVQVISKLLAPANGQIKHGCKYQALRNVKRVQASLVAQVVWIAVVPAYGAGFQPIDFRVGVVDEFGHSVAGEYLGPCREALLDLHLHGVVNGIAIIRLLEVHAIPLRERQEQLSCFHLKTRPHTP